MAVAPPGRGSSRPRSGERGSSSAIGVMLMVVVTLAVVGAVGVQVLGSGSFAPPAPRVAFDYEFTDEGSDDALVVEHLSGEPVDGDRLVVVVSGAAPPEANGRYGWNGTALSGGAEVSAGSAVRLNASTIGDGSALNLDGATVEVVWQPPGGDGSRPLSEWDSAAQSTGTDAEAVSKVDGSAVASNTKKLTFEVSATRTVTVESFAVETAGNLSSISSVDGSKEFKVTGGASGGHADAPSGYPTDGTAYALNDTAKTDPDETSKIRVRKFPDKIDVFGFTDAAGADVSVTLVFADGSTKTLHFSADVA